MIAEVEEPVSLITQGHVLEVERIGQGIESAIVGKVKTLSGGVYRFRAFFSQEALLDAFYGNKPIRLSGWLQGRGEECIFTMDQTCRVETERCMKTVSRPVGDDRYKDFPCGQSGPCRFHQSVTTCQNVGPGRRHTYTCEVYGGARTCGLGMRAI